MNALALTLVPQPAGSAHVRAFAGPSVILGPGTIGDRDSS